MDAIKQIGLADLPRIIRRPIEGAIESRDPCALYRALTLAHPLVMVAQLSDELRKQNGLYEAVLVKAYKSPKRIPAEMTTEQILLLLRLADRKTLLTCGGKRPPCGSVRLYRGIAGNNHSRRSRGVAWTTLRRRACWFAWQDRMNLGGDPAVYRMTADAAEIFFATRDEGEVIAFSKDRPTRLALPLRKIKAEHDTHKDVTHVSEKDGA